MLLCQLFEDLRGLVENFLGDLQSLIDRGESTYKHLMGTNWNVKEGVGIIKEYLSLLKYGTTVPDNL